MPHFIPPRLLIQRLWLCVSGLRSISSMGLGADAQEWKNLAHLSVPERTIPEMRKLITEIRTQTPMKTQLWRLQDLRSGGLVYSLELFIQAIKSTGKAAFRKQSLELYGGTFLVLIRKWDDDKKYKHGVWTERLLIDLLRHVLPTSDDPSSDQIPTYIIDLFLTFLAEVVVKKSGRGDHVQDAVSRIKTYSQLKRPDHPSKETLKALSSLESAGT